MGIKRDREPFILSNELYFFLKYFCHLDFQVTEDLAANEKDNDEEMKSLKQKGEDDKDQQEEGQAKEQQLKTYRIYFNEQKDQARKESRSRSRHNKGDRFSPEDFEEAFEKLASHAFLKIRQNADIFINLLVLMLVAGLEELDQASIGFIKKALFLNVSEEEATV